MKTRIGIVGGGQLGRMLTLEAKRLGFHVVVIDPTPSSPAGQVADKQIVANFKDDEAIKALASEVDFMTFEVELANAEVLEKLSKEGVKINPSAKTLTLIKDKLAQKKFLRKVGIPVADFLEVTNREGIIKAADEFGYPMVLKARFDAYDGRGNAVIKTERDIDRALKKLEGRKLYIERHVKFARELAMMASRSTKGEIVTYPVVETIQKNNICHTVFAPARVDKKIVVRAKKLAISVLDHLKGAGVFGIEMFLTKEGKVLINELAPRVHNSGHYSIEGCVTSQFEQHIRAITGLPLGSTDMIMKAAVMINILGERTASANVSGIEKALMIPQVYVHIYGKSETKPERKMGHITAIDKTITGAYNKAKLASKYISI